MHLTEEDAGVLVDLGTTAEGMTPYEKGVIAGRELWSPMLADHPNSAMYKVGMQSMWFLAGVRAGSVGLTTQGEMLEYQQGVIFSVKECRKNLSAS